MFRNTRIVFFCGTLMQGGAERVISILSSKMKEQGYNVEILLFYDRAINYDVDPRIKITIVEKECASKSLLKRMLWMRQFMKNNADIIVSFLAPFNMLALVSHLGLKSKIIVADRNDPRHVPNKFIIRKLRDALYRFADGIVVQTMHNQRYFSREIQKKSVVISNPVALGDKAGLALRTEKKHEIVSVGRLMPQKNQMMLLEAFARIIDEFPDYCLTIYGDGPEKEHLLQRARSLGIQNRFFLPGNVQDVFDRIAKSELFVLCSNYEGMPNALIEAMCLGLPCVSTLVSGVEELIEHGVNGDIIKIGSTDEMVACMRNLLSNQNRRRVYAENAVKLHSSLDVELIMQQWISYLDDICVDYKF